MRSLLFAIFLLASTAAPASLPTPQSLPVTFGGAFGHVCPTGPNEVFTARHVIYIPVDKLDFAAVPVKWSLPGNYNGGTIFPKAYSRSLDIARGESKEPFPFFYSLAVVDPKVGDVVYVNGYADKGESIHKQVIVKTKIVGFTAGVMVLDKSPGPGSSGSCVFNSEREVVGINFALSLKAGEPNEGIAVVLTHELVENLRKVDGQ